METDFVETDFVKLTFWRLTVKTDFMETHFVETDFVETDCVETDFVSRHPERSIEQDTLDCDYFSNMPFPCCILLQDLHNRGITFMFGANIY